MRGRRRPARRHRSPPIRGLLLRLAKTVDHDPPADDLPGDDEGRPQRHRDVGMPHGPGHGLLHHPRRGLPQQLHRRRVGGDEREWDDPQDGEESPVESSQRGEHQYRREHDDHVRLRQPGAEKEEHQRQRDADGEEAGRPARPAARDERGDQQRGRPEQAQQPPVPLQHEHVRPQVRHGGERHGADHGELRVGHPGRRSVPAQCEEGEDIEDERAGGEDGRVPPGAQGRAGADEEEDGEQHRRRRRLDADRQRQHDGGEVAPPGGRQQERCQGEERDDGVDLAPDGADVEQERVEEQCEPGAPDGGGRGAEVLQRRAGEVREPRVRRDHRQLDRDRVQVEVRQERVAQAVDAAEQQRPRRRVADRVAPLEHPVVEHGPQVERQVGTVAGADEVAGRLEDPQVVRGVVRQHGEGELQQDAEDEEATVRCAQPRPAPARPGRGLRSGRGGAPPDHLAGLSSLTGTRGGAAPPRWPGAAPRGSRRPGDASAAGPPRTSRRRQP